MVRWIEPVYDRTQADVDYAKRQVEEWSKGYFSNDATFIINLKGAFNAQDLNRIEGNMQYVCERLAIAGTKVQITTKADWNASDIPSSNDIQRIISNLSVLIEAWYLLPNAPHIPETILAYTDANAIGRNISAPLWNVPSFLTVIFL